MDRPRRGGRRPGRCILPARRGRHRRGDRRPCARAGAFADADALSGAWKQIVCACAAARVVPVILSAVLPYARPGGGLGAVLGGRVRAVVALVLGAGICLLLGGTVVLVVALGTAVLSGAFAYRWLGGVTGDVLGAAAEIAELAALV